MRPGHAIPIGIVGDFDASRPTHVATDAALAHAAGALGVDVRPIWLATDALLASPLEAYAGFFVAPGSPYRSADGALRAIAHARERARPLLGTCGGFQHVVLEFARNVLGRRAAQSAELDPHAPDLVVEPLACPLVGERAVVLLRPDSCAATFYGADAVTEEFRCSFGLAAAYAPALERAGLAVSGVDAAGEPRVVELREHPFFLATLFVPQLSSTAQRPHPLLTAFVAAMVGRAGRRST